jgi:putative Holliday junction resolvase
VDNHNTQEFLGVDVGQVRVGIARGSSVARIAQPLKTVPAAQALDELENLVKTHSASGIVVGLPRSLDGRETEQTKIVRDWAAQAKARLSLPFYWQDEALTSQQVESQKSKVKSVGTDAEAAAVILQDFLDSPESDRVAV